MKVNFASWKTTVAGLAYIALMALEVYLRERGVTGYDQVFEMAKAAAVGAGLFFARDNVVSSERAGAN